MLAMETQMNMGDKVFDITRDRMWAGGLAEALDEARANGKYLLIATGAEPTRSWKLGVALAFLDEDMLGLSRKFHCVTVADNRAANDRLIERPTLLVCTPEGREIVSATADTVEELIPALRGMLEHVVAMEKLSITPTVAKAPIRKEKTIRYAHVDKTPARLSMRCFFASLAHAILG